MERWALASPTLDAVRLARLQEMITTVVDEGAGSSGWTVQAGFYVEGCAVFTCFSASIGPAVGSDWSVELLGLSSSIGVSSQPASFDIGAFVEETTASSVDELQGLELYGGVGFGEGIIFNADHLDGVGADGLTYEGSRASLGAGAGFLPIDGHAGTTASFNPTRALWKLIFDD